MRISKPTSDMELNEEVVRIKELIFELSDSSESVESFFEKIENYPELIDYLDFNNKKDLRDYVNFSSFRDFHQLVDEVEKFFNEKNKGINDEMDEIERAVQDLNRNENIETSVKDVANLFNHSSETILTSDIWSKLENTESNQIHKGEINKVIALAKQYNKTSPLKLKNAILNNKYNPPLILKFGDRYHLVAGNTRLCTAAAMGVNPKVLIAELG
jgi:hypothetical protein